MSPTCRRYEEEALPRLEAGETLEDPHFATCPDCRAARAAYEELTAALAATANERAPAGWQRRVLAVVDDGAQEAPPGPAPLPTRWAPPLRVAASLAAAALVGVATWVSWPVRVAPVRLDQSVLAGTTTARGAGERARPGDQLELVASPGEASYAELRVYRNRGELVAACGAATAPCSRRGGRLTLKLTLDLRGEYLPLLLLAPAPLAALPGTLDADVATAQAAGARIETGREVVVR